MKIKINTIWHGKAGFNTKYLGQDLVLVHGNEIMELPVLKQGECKTAKKWYTDQYGGEPYRLTYIKWKPTIEQKKLL